MAEYIEREAAMKAITSYFEPVNIVDEAVLLNYLLKKLMLPPAADVVSRATFEQVMWERDVAIQQLKDLGVGFGEKADVAPVVRCKDCRWWNRAGCAIRIVDDTDKPQANDFCSYGEPKGERRSE